MKMLKAYTVTDPALAKKLFNYGLSCANIGKLIGANKNKVTRIMNGDYPISGENLETIEKAAQENNPKFSMSEFSFKNGGFVDEHGTRLIKCRTCGKYFAPPNARMRYCSDTCRDQNTSKPLQTDSEEKEQKKRELSYAESTYEEARRRHINYGDVQKERTLEAEPTVMQRWEAYQRDRQCKTSESL